MKESLKSNRHGSFLPYNSLSNFLSNNVTGNDTDSNIQNNDIQKSQIDINEIFDIIYGKNEHYNKMQTIPMLKNNPQARELFMDIEREISRYELDNMYDVLYCISKDLNDLYKIAGKNPRNSLQMFFCNDTAI